ncbi:MAG: thioredoxin domain-containing protein [Planctomycetota bacterium]|jgi:uncharacterized protein YyaL (SSP411 family)
MGVATEHKHTNRLIHAISPYLLQHAHNPVDWHEWAPETLDKAKREDKPIFLSIGYAACHWCHVMEHESFEKEEVAAVLNRHFVSIKVDREERPDIDVIYMAYTQARTRHGGWPMSVWLTPDGRPFHAGTYFPKQRLLQILGNLADTWKNDRDQINSAAEGAETFFARWSAEPTSAEGGIPHAAVDHAAATLAQYFDHSTGGISGGGSNKFPPSMAMELMLRAYRRTRVAPPVVGGAPAPRTTRGATPASGDSELLDPVELTLKHMARGGIYDHLGGGICRYSTDREWLVPHFEKMLYDQATVSSIYLDAYQVTRGPLYARVVADIFDYVLSDLRSPQGGFYSSRDADSGGLEGAYYIWTVEEIHSLLGDEDGRLFCEYYDVSKMGNWFEGRGHAPEGPKNILHITEPPESFAKSHGLELDEFNRRLRAWREKLLSERVKREPPALDDKILTSWNGLMIASLAKGARVLDEPKYAAAAAKAADFILRELRRDGRLLRTYRDGRSRLMGYLDDYAFFVQGLLNLYEAMFDQRWLDEAVALTDTAINYYHDETGGAFFFTASDAEQLVARSKDPHDGAIPAGNAVQALNLLRLAILFDRKDYRAKAESIFRAFGRPAVSSPAAFETLLCAADFYNDHVREIAIIGDPSSPETVALMRTVYDRYLPNKVVVSAPDNVGDAGMPLLRFKTRMNGKPTAYVCEHYNCKLPVTTPEALAKQLDAR